MVTANLPFKMFSEAGYYLMKQLLRLVLIPSFAIFFRMPGKIESIWVAGLYLISSNQVFSFTKDFRATSACSENNSYSHKNMALSKMFYLFFLSFSVC